MSNEIEVCSSCWEEECVCDYEQYIYLDENIADAIINMNFKGYKTLYSCEGHIEPDDGNANSHVLDIYFVTQNRLDTLPEGFLYPRGKAHKDAHHTILYKYIDGKLHARINKKYIPYDLEKDKKESLDNLKRWVETLPIIDKKTNPLCYSDYMVHGKPKQPEYSYEVKGWNTYCIELDKQELDKVEQHINEHQGKIEELEEYDGIIKLFYLAHHDLFIDDNRKNNNRLK